MRRRSGARGTDELHEPLLEDDECKDRTRSGSTAGPLVPHSINKFDWEQLLRDIVSSCQKGWNSVRETIVSCLGNWLSGQSSAVRMSPIQEDRIRHLQQRIQVPYNGSNPTHQDALKQLWQHAFPDTPFISLRHQKWTDMGWQRDDPASDFRGGGFVALQNLLYLAQEEPALFRSLLHKSHGTRSDWEYPFAVAGINLTVMLEEVIGLRDSRTAALLPDPQTSRTAAGRGFLQQLSVSECAFEELYCMAFELLDREWLSMRASYMDFPAVIGRVRKQSEAALAGRPATTEELRRLLLS